MEDIYGNNDELYGEDDAQSDGDDRAMVNLAREVELVQPRSYGTSYAKVVDPMDLRRTAYQPGLEADDLKHHIKGVNYYLGSLLYPEGTKNCGVPGTVEITIKKQVVISQNIVVPANATRAVIRVLPGNSRYPIVVLFFNQNVFLSTQVYRYPTADFNQFDKFRVVGAASEVYSSTISTSNAPFSGVLSAATHITLPSILSVNTSDPGITATSRSYILNVPLSTGARALWLPSDDFSLYDTQNAYNSQTSGVIVNPNAFPYSATIDSTVNPTMFAVTLPLNVAAATPNLVLFSLASTNVYSPGMFGKVRYRISARFTVNSSITGTNIMQLGARFIAIDQSTTYQNIAFSYNGAIIIGQYEFTTFGLFETQTELQDFQVVVVSSAGSGFQLDSIRMELEFLDYDQPNTGRNGMVFALDGVIPSQSIVVNLAAQLEMIPSLTLGRNVFGTACDLPIEDRHAAFYVMYNATNHGLSLVHPRNRFRHSDVMKLIDRKAHYLQCWNLGVIPAALLSAAKYLIRNNIGSISRGARTLTGHAVHKLGEIADAEKDRLEEIRRDYGL